MAEDEEVEKMKRFAAIALPVIAGIAVKFAGISVSEFIRFQWFISQSVLAGSPSDILPFLLKYLIFLASLGLWSAALSAGWKPARLSVLLSLPIIGFSPASVALHLSMLALAFLPFRPSRMMPLACGLSLLVASLITPAYFQEFKDGLLNGMAEGLMPYVSGMQKAMAEALGTDAQEISKQDVLQLLEENIDLKPLERWFPWMLGLAAYFSVSSGLLVVEGIESMLKKPFG